MYRGTEGLVLKSFDIGEADQILTVFSRDSGKISVMVKGVKKPQSSLRGMVQPFCLSHFFLTRSGDIYLMTQGKIIKFYGNIRENLTKTLQAVYILELLDKSLAESDPNPALFLLTAELFRFMDENESSPLVLRFFEIKLLGLLGFAPQLNRCCGCGKDKELTFFSESGGGAVCMECAPTLKARHIKPGIVAVLRTLQKNQLGFLKRLQVSPELEVQVEKVLEDYLEYYLERRFNLKNVMRALKGL